MSRKISKTVCFACTTPYQVIGAIDIVMDKKLTADLYLFGMFDGYKAVAERLQASGVFRRVFHVDTTKTKAPGKKGAFIQMLRCRRVVGEFLPANAVYAEIYASSRAHVKNLLIHELIRRNPKLKINIYDDGMGTYAKDSHVLNTTGRRGRAEKLLGWQLFTPERVRFLVYLPELFERPKGLESCPVAQMPRIDWSGEAGELLAEAFGAKETDMIREKVIIFDPLRGMDSERAAKFPTIDRCYDMLAERFGRENVVVKPHPRSTIKPAVKARLYENSGLPMEVLYAKMDDVEDRLLVSYASSAVYTPKMFFDAEPRIINLFALVDGADGGSEWETQYRKFKRIYRDPSRVSAPQTMEELEALLQNVHGI